MSCGKTIANAIGAIRLNRPSAARPAGITRARRGARARTLTQKSQCTQYTQILHCTVSVDYLVVGGRIRMQEI